MHRVIRFSSLRMPVLSTAAARTSLIRPRVAALVVALLVVATGCGDDGESVEQPTSAPQAVSSTSPPPEPDPSFSEQDGSLNGGETDPSRERGRELVAPLAEESDFSLSWAESEISRTALGDRIFATEGGFVAYEFPLTTHALVSSDGIGWTDGTLEFAGASGAVEANLITPGGPGFFSFGMATDDLIWISSDGMAWSRHDLDLVFPELGVFNFAEVERVVAGRDELLLIGRMDRGSPDQHRWFAWTSPDGADWTLVPEPFGEGSYVRDVLPTTAGFITHGYVEGSDDGGFIWWSADGTSWERTSDELAPDALGLIADQGLAVWDDRIVAAGETEGGIRLWTSLDGRSWEPLPDSALLMHGDDFNVHAASITAGPAGIALLGEIQVTPTDEPPLVVEKDGLVVTLVLADGRLVISDAASGAPLIETRLGAALEGKVEGVIIDQENGSLTVIRPDDGSEVFFSAEDFERAQSESGAGDGEGIGPIPVLWFSPDGTRWTIVDPGEAFGSDAGQSGPGIVVGDDAVILHWTEHEQSDYGEGDYAGDEGRTVVWVGSVAGG